MLSKTAFPAEEMEVARAIDAIGGVYLVSLRRLSIVRQSLRLAELGSWTQAHENMLLYIRTFDTAPVALQMSFTCVISRLVQGLPNGTYLSRDQASWSNFMIHH